MASVRTVLAICARAAAPAPTTDLAETPGSSISQEATEPVDSELFVSGT